MHAAHQVRFEPHSVAICPINIEEFMRGRLAPLGRVLSGSKHLDAYARLVAAEATLRLFPLAPFDAASEGEFNICVRHVWA
jgi:hypothetical protein